MLFATAIGIGDKRSYADAPANCSQQGLFHFSVVKAKDENIDTLLGAIDALNNSCDAVVRLNQ